MNNSLQANLVLIWGRKRRKGLYKEKEEEIEASSLADVNSADVCGCGKNWQLWDLKNP